jgi:hypothetical protein
MPVARSIHAPCVSLHASRFAGFDKSALLRLPKEWREMFLKTKTKASPTHTYESGVQQDRAGAQHEFSRIDNLELRQDD